MAPTCICFLPILDYLWSRPTTSSCLFYSRKQYRRLMGGLDTHSYMPGEWSAGLLEVAGGPGCSMALTCICFLPILDYLWSDPPHPHVCSTHENSTGGSWLMGGLDTHAYIICPGSGAQGCLRSPGDLVVVWRSPVSVSSPSWTTCGPDPPHPHVHPVYMRIAAEAENSHF